MRRGIACGCVVLSLGCDSPGESIRWPEGDFALAALIRFDPDSGEVSGSPFFRYHNEPLDHGFPTVTVREGETLSLLGWKVEDLMQVEPALNPDALDRIVGRYERGSCEIWTLDDDDGASSTGPAPEPSQVIELIGPVPPDDSLSSLSEAIEVTVPVLADPCHIPLRTDLAPFGDRGKLFPIGTPIGGARSRTSTR